MNIRHVTEEDLGKIRAFVKDNPPLGFHTLYTYWVLYSQFGRLWHICEENGNIVGFISGIKSVSEPSTVLIWQIGVSKNIRGKGVSTALIDEFLSSCKQLGIENGLVTIDPSNKVSLGLFQSYFNKYSSFNVCGSLSLSDEFCKDDEYEDIYTFKI
ncbi:MAG: GNAT family N-acetyltransferase [Gammaproteobacteria bacterium]|jgi:L-2,4-diaminobutyric acid acetyltransferase